MASFLYRIGNFAARRHWIVIAIWAILLVGISSLGGVLGSHTVSSFTIPGTQSQVALDMLEERFPAASGVAVKVIYIAPDKAEITTFQSQVEGSLTSLSAIPGVISVGSPFTAENSGQIAADGSMAYAAVQLSDSATDIPVSVYDAIMTAGSQAGVGGITLAYTGIPDAVTAENYSTELVGGLISLIVLLITFGSLLAAGMPLITAAIGVGISGAFITVMSSFVTLSSTTSALGSMIGLAVGIDYALFIISRHRSNLATGMDPKQSVAVSTATAGSAVLFAGLTVIIALMGLFVVGIPFLGMMGLGAAIAVFVAICVAVTLVPAILSLLGKRLIPRKGAKAFTREQPQARRTMGARWVVLVTAKPLITIVLVVGALLVLAIPATSLRLSLPDAGYNPVGSTTRTGYDAMSAGFGAGTNGPLMVVADISKTNVAQLETVLQSLHGAFLSDSDVQSVSPAVPNSTLDMAVVIVTPKSSSDSVATEELVQRLRAQAQAFETKNGFSYEITGQTAMGVDISQRLTDAILPFGLIVVGLSIILLMIVFRSIAVPISATLGFVLSVGATFGITNAIFEWGWGAELLGVTKVGPVISFMPILVMAVLFGLAMDYEVFLVSRMRERFVATGEVHGSVRAGFTHSARVVTAASLIMFSVFISFVPGGGVMLQSIALALAIGVAIDALIVRMTLIPAVMTLLGKYAWALPRKLAARVPDVDIEGERVHGHLETLKWHQDADDTIVIAAHHVNVVDAQLALFDFEAHVGTLVIFEASPDVAADLALAALTGRAQALGLVVSCGRPLPYDASHVRRWSSLVTYGAPAMEGSVRDQIREQLRLNHVSGDAAHREQLGYIVTALAESAGIRLGAFNETRSTEDLTTDESWVIDCGIALIGDSRVIAVDARNLPTTRISDFVSAVCEHASATATLLVATTQSPTLTVENREMITVILSPAVVEVPA